MRRLSVVLLASALCMGAISHVHAQSPSSSLLQVQADYEEDTQPFTAPSDWTISYAYDCTAFADTHGGVFSAFVRNADGSTALNAKDVDILVHGNRSSGSQIEHTAGAFSLRVISDCPWSINVTAP